MRYEYKLFTWLHKDTNDFLLKFVVAQMRNNSDECYSTVSRQQSETEIRCHVITGFTVLAMASATFGGFSPCEAAMP